VATFNYNIISYGPTRPLKDGALPLMTFHSWCVISHYILHTLWPHLFIIRVGQNRIYTPYMAVYSIKSLQKLLYIHRIYMALANPIYNIISYGPTRPLKDGALPLMTFYSCCVKAGYGATIKVHTQLYTHTHTHNNTHSLTHLHTRRSWTCWALACGTCGTSRGKPCHRKWCLASPWRRCPFWRSCTTRGEWAGVVYVMCRVGQNHIYNIHGV